MKIQYCSDLHLEFDENKAYLDENPLKVVGDILILAGDIMLFKDMSEHSVFFDFVSKNFETTYWIAGNHEYYFSDASLNVGSFHIPIRKNVFLVNNYSEVKNTVRLVFSTLWTKISPANQWYIQRNMSDFKVIDYKGERFSPTTANYLCKQNVDFLTKTLSKKRRDNFKTVVVTHHVPTFLNYPEQYKGDALNEGFAVELFDLIEATKPAYWIYGHHHVNIPAFKKGETQLLTNQLGYMKDGGADGFDSGKVILID